MKFQKTHIVSYNKELILYHLDTPHDCMEISSEHAKQHTISGWVVSRDPSHKISVEIESNGGIKKVCCNTQRKDVVEHFKKNHTNLYPILECGFHFNEVNASNLKIFCGEELALNILFEIVDSNLEHEWSFLRELNLAHIERNHDLPKTKLETYLADGVYKLISNNSSELKMAYWLPDEINECLNDFITNSRKFEFGPNMVESAIKKGFIEIGSPLQRNESATCSCSFYVAPFNYLKFITKGIVFYIIQHFSFCDAIYIPAYGVFFFSPGIVKELWYKVIAKTTLSASNTIQDGLFNSVFITHDRPYHYNYDLALGVFLLEKKRLLEQIPSLILNEERAFFSISRCINKNINEKILSPKDFNRHLNSPGFSILAGHQVVHSANESAYLELFKDLDSVILKNCLAHSQTTYINNIVSKLTDGDVTLWFGITSQKRKLLNQVDEIVRAINVFSMLFERVGVVIDGWTSPLKPSEKDLLEIDNDTQVLIDIKNKVISSNVDFFSSIGASSEEKIIIAKHVDVFLANHATGSMHVDRIAGRFGVTHNSNTWVAADFAHLHRNSIKISSSNITDVINSDKGQDFIDYQAREMSIANAMLHVFYTKKTLQEKQ